MDNLIGNIDSIETDKGNIIIKSTNSIFCSSFYFQDYYDEKLTTKFINCTKALIRKSKEYNDYLSLLKTNYNILNFDNILSNITESDASIEFHHYPLSLHNIVDIVMAHHIINNENFNSFTIAKEVMNLHYAHKIGIVPLSITNHQLAHDDGLFISFDQVFGDWRAFYKEYSDGVSNEIKTKIKKLEELSDAGMASDFRGIY